VADEGSAADREVNDFTNSLRKLHEEAGGPSLRAMSRIAHYSHTALSNVLGGGRLPSLDLTLAFVRACRGNEDEWRARWFRARQRVDAAAVAETRAASRVATLDPTSSARTGRLRLLPVAVLSGAAAILAVMLVFVALALFAGTSPRDPHEIGAASKTSHSCPAQTSSKDNPLIPCDGDRFIADVTIPDGTVVRVNQTFVKVWEIQNTGLVTWRGRYVERQGMLRGPGVCTSPARVPVPTTLPGQAVKISVTFKAPSLPGSCLVDFKMTDAQGRLYFPNLSGIYVSVYVKS
jgi:hypothetical protein